MTGKIRQGGLFDLEPGPLFQARPPEALQPVAARLYLCDLRFDPRRFWQALRHDGRAMDHWDLGYAVHGALCGLFGKASAPKPFHVVRRRPDDRVIRVLAQTPLDQTAIGRILDRNETAWRQAVTVQQVHAMPWAGELSGMTCPFVLHARPTVRRHKVVGGKEQDLELDAFHADCERRTGQAPRQQTEVYAEWLTEQLQREGACKVSTVRVDAWELTPTYRKQQPAPDSRNARRGFKQLRLPAADFTGTLQVQDADRFQTLWARGVGRHRAFGCGMLLLKPAT